MLVRLILFLALTGVLWTAIAWWRRQRRGLPSGDRLLDAAELDRLHRLAKTNPRLEQAIKLRGSIVRAGTDGSRAELGTKVDAALKRLSEQVMLRDRISSTLQTIDRDRLAREAAGARAQANDAGPDDPVHSLATQLALQVEQVDRLSERMRALESAADKIVLLLGNLNLALLEAESSQATEDGDKVGLVLADLEEAGEHLRRTTEAEEEVNRMIKAKSAAVAQS